MSDNLDIVRSLDGIRQAVQNPYQLSSYVDANGWTVRDFGPFIEYTIDIANSNYATGTGDNDFTFGTVSMPVGVTVIDHECEIITRYQWTKTSWNVIWRGFGTTISGSSINLRVHVYNGAGVTNYLTFQYTLRLVREV